jgi:hypothetical protein
MTVICSGSKVRPARKGVIGMRKLAQLGRADVPGMGRAVFGRFEPEWFGLNISV